MRFPQISREANLSAELTEASAEPLKQRGEALPESLQALQQVPLRPSGLGIALRLEVLKATERRKREGNRG